jgi:hypothetical protein
VALAHRSGAADSLGRYFTGRGIRSGPHESAGKHAALTCRPGYLEGQRLGSIGATTLGRCSETRSRMHTCGLHMKQSARRGAFAAGCAVSDRGRPPRGGPPHGHPSQPKERSGKKRAGFLRTPKSVLVRAALLQGRRRPGPASGRARGP